MTIDTKVIELNQERNVTLSCMLLAVGEDLKQAHLRAVYVEDAARICSIAMTQGKPVVIPEKDIEAMRGF